MHSLIFAKTINHLKSGQKAAAATALSRISESELLPKGRDLYRRLRRLQGGDQDGSRLAPLESEINEVLVGGVSLVTACMNRNANLLRVLPTWLSLDVNEIIIVDWGSAEILSVALQNFDDSRIRIVRINNVDEWCATLAFNVGLRLASSEITFKLDCDISVTKDFLQQNIFEVGQFIRGNWESAVDADLFDQKYVNGSFGAFKSDLIEAGFYNENIRTYGWEDSDLYSRLAANQIESRFLSLASVAHLDHDMSERLTNQNVPRSSFLGEFPATEFHNIKNKFLCSSLPTWDGRGLKDFYVEELDPQILQLSMAGDLEVIPEESLNKAKVEALKEMLGWLGFAGQSLLETCIKSREFADKIIEHYEFGIPYDLSCDFLLSKGTIEPFWEPQYLCGELLGAAQCIYASANHDSMAITFKHRGRAWWILPSASRTAQQWPGAGLGSNEKLQQLTFFVTSVFDEQIEQRQQEYISAVSLNLGLFDFVVLFYENDSGLMREKLEALEFSFKIIWIDVPTRPTFELMFETMNVLAPTALVTIANADVCFDDALDSLFQYPLDNTLLVVSRLDEVALSAGSLDWLRLKNGLPNTFSADAWIYLAPLGLSFKCDYQIGSFHCDSFMNFRAVNAGLRVLNPCLDIPLRHLHNPINNSSAQKEADQKLEIWEKLVAESESIAGGNALSAIRGIQWGRLCDLTEIQRSFSRELIWSDQHIQFIVDEDGLNLLQVCLLAAKLNEVKRETGVEDLSIWIGASRNISPIAYKMLMRFQCEFGAHSFYLNTATADSYRDQVLVDELQVDSLIRALQVGDELQAESESYQILKALDFELDGSRTEQFISWNIPTSHVLVSALASSLVSVSLERLVKVINSDQQLFGAMPLIGGDINNLKYLE